MAPVGLCERAQTTNSQQAAFEQCPSAEDAWCLLKSIYAVDQLGEERTASAASPEGVGSDVGHYYSFTCNAARPGRCSRAADKKTTNIACRRPRRTSSQADKENKEVREPRKAVWSSTLPLQCFPPVDPSLTEQCHDSCREALAQSCDGALACRPRPQSAPSPKTCSLHTGPPPIGQSKQRPQSAPVRKPKMHMSCPTLQQQLHHAHASTAGKTALHRPASASRLLRGDGLLTRFPHRCPILQDIEDKEIRRSVQRLKREHFVEKDFIEGIDVWQDSHLTELKVLHNVHARRHDSRKAFATHQIVNARPSPSSRSVAQVNHIGPLDPGWANLSASIQMRNLRQIYESGARADHDDSETTLITIC